MSPKIAGAVTACVLIASCSVFLYLVLDTPKTKWQGDRVVSAKLVTKTTTKPLYNKCGDFKGWESGPTYFEVVTEKDSNYLFERYAIEKEKMVLKETEVKYK